MLFLSLLAVASAHLCLLEPHQRGSMKDLNTAGESWAERDKRRLSYIYYIPFALRRRLEKGCSFVLGIYFVHEAACQELGARAGWAGYPTNIIVNLIILQFTHNIIIRINTFLDEARG